MKIDVRAVFQHQRGYDVKACAVARMLGRYWLAAFGHEQSLAIERTDQGGTHVINVFIQPFLCYTSRAGKAFCINDRASTFGKRACSTITYQSGFAELITSGLSLHLFLDILHKLLVSSLFT